MLGNSLAHLIARLTGLGSGIVTIPLVTLTLGTEALGLVGVYATLQAILGLFDLGLPVIVNQRLAVMISHNAPHRERAVFVRTLEFLFWSMVALFVVMGLSLCGPLAQSWLNVSTLSHANVSLALVVIVFTAALRFPAAFYSNVLFAHDRHIFPNAVAATSAMLRTLVALIALMWFQVGIVGFFVIQLIASVVEIALLAAGAWWLHTHRWVAPQWSLLRDIAPMTGALTIISLTAVVLSQIDKIVLSKLLSLGDFGIYSAAYTLAAGLVTLAYPVGNAVFPDLARGFDSIRPVLRRLVDGAVELTILAVVPLGCVMVMQSEALLGLLFLDKPIPQGLGGILSMMALGGIAQAFITLPHLFQVAVGRIAIVAKINVILILPYVVAVYMAGWNGVNAAATCFAILNITRLFIHWSVLMKEGQRLTWELAIVMSLVSTAGGLVMAAIPAAFSLSDYAALVAAVISVPILTLALAVLLPRSRERLTTLVGLRFSDQKSRH